MPIPVGDAGRPETIGSGTLFAHVRRFAICRAVPTPRHRHVLLFFGPCDLGEPRCPPAPCDICSGNLWNSSPSCPRIGISLDPSSHPLLCLASPASHFMAYFCVRMSLHVFFVGAVGDLFCTLALVHVFNAQGRSQQIRPIPAAHLETTSSFFVYTAIRACLPRRLPSDPSVEVVTWAAFKGGIPVPDMYREVARRASRKATPVDMASSGLAQLLVQQLLRKPKLRPKSANSGRF